MKVVIEAHKLENLIGPLVRQAPFVAMKAINDTLFDARRDVVNNQMPKHIDKGPTSWTKRGVRYEKAKKNYLQGVLYIDTKRDYLKHPIKGKPLTAKRNILVAPVMGRMRLTKQGNIGRKRIETLASKPNYFVGMPSNRHSQQAYGLYKIVGRGKNKKLERHAYMNLKTRPQRKTYDAPGLTQGYVERVIKKNILRAARKAARTSY